MIQVETFSGGNSLDELQRHVNNFLSTFSDDDISSVEFSIAKYNKNAMVVYKVKE